MDKQELINHIDHAYRLRHAGFIKIPEMVRRIRFWIEWYEEKEG
jgi:hypothetical protein